METAIPRIKRKIVAVQRRAAEGTIEQSSFEAGASTLTYRSETGSLHVFGANVHQWHLYEPLPQQAVADWEADMGILLPEQYRLFVTEIGHVGMAPYYGLIGLYYPLENPYRGEAQKPWMRRYYSATCIYREGVEDDSDKWLVDAAGADWESQWDAETFDPQQGTLTLCEQGCGYETVIVLNGEHRGRVANAYHTSPPQFAPHDGFLSWYEGWLDAVLTGRSPDWYGYPPRTPQDKKP